MKPLKAIKSPKKRFVPLVSTKAFDIDEDGPIVVVKVPRDFNLEALDGARGRRDWFQGSGSDTGSSIPLDNGYILRNAVEEAMQHQLKCLVPSSESANGYCSGPVISAVLSVVKGEEGKSQTDVERLKETIRKLIPPDPRVPVPNAKVYYPTGVACAAAMEREVRENELNGHGEKRKKKKRKAISVSGLNGHAPKVKKKTKKKKKKKEKEEEEEKEKEEGVTKKKGQKSKSKSKKEKKKKKKIKQ